MTILYLISTFEKGVGGHYFSLQSTLESLTPEVTPVVINIGRVESPVIDKLECQKYQFIYKYYNYLQIQRRITKVIEENNVSRIHCFDDRAYLFVRNSRFSKFPLALTKCGGPNFRFFPKVPNLILFSKENLDHFRDVPGFKNIHLIPNRSLPFQPSPAKVESLRRRIKLKEDKKVFLRITRISEFYKYSLEQSIHLVNALENAVLIIVGQVVDRDVLEFINLLGGKNVHIVTEELYYTNAKEIIPICDFYIGTGRGIMEATSLRKIVLTPVTNKKYPALVTEENFQSFFDTNFSERNIISTSNEKILEDIKEVVESPKKRDEMAEFSQQMFSKHFNIHTQKKRYLNFYDQLTEGANIAPLNRLKHFLFFHYHYITQG